MTALPALDSRCFFARAARIRSLNRIDAALDLDFGISIERTFVIEDLPVEGMSEELALRAKHCLIVLAGGKRLIVRPDPRLRDRWEFLRSIPARVYLLERVAGRPVGYVETLTEASGPALELAPYLTWLSLQDFDVDLVKETLNGGR